MLLFLIVALCAMAIYSRADPILTLTTTESDYLTPKIDYSPEENVYIAGTGFDASTGILVSVQRPDGTVTTSADLITGPYKVTITSSETGITDASGSFTATYQLDGVTGEYTITATDGTNTKTATFTDSIQIDTVDPSDSAGTTKTSFLTTDDVYAHVTYSATGDQPVNVYIVTSLPGGTNPSLAGTDVRGSPTAVTFSDTDTTKLVWAATLQRCCFAVID